MKEGQSGGKACVVAIKALRRLFLGEFRDGGWLPSGRDMARRLDVSHMTYCKALNRMVKEGFVRSFPKKGHYVTPEHLRCRKVGLIFWEGESSPFLGIQDAVAILRVLSERRFNAQIIQGCSLDQLHDTALAHGVEGLLWLYPSLKAVAHIGEIDAYGELPLVVVHGTHRSFGEMPNKGGVTYDTKQIYAERAKLMLSRGHRHVAYVGGDYEAAQKLGLVAALKKGGVNMPPELCIKDLLEAPGRLGRLLVTHGVTGLLSEGAGDRVDRLFTELSELPDSARPEVLASRFPLLPSLFQRYPKVRPVPATELMDDLGEVAARMLLDHLLDGKPLSQVKVGIRFQQQATLPTKLL